MSSTYVAVPVIRRGSSRRRIRFPTRVSGLAVVVAIGLRSCLCGRSHRVDDVLIPGAAAKISLQTVPDFFVGRPRIAVENLLRRHDHAGRAEAALQSVLVPEGLLHRVE